MWSCRTTATSTHHAGTVFITSKHRYANCLEVYMAHNGDIPKNSLQFSVEVSMHHSRPCFNPLTAFVWIPGSKYTTLWKTWQSKGYSTMSNKVLF